MEQGEKDSDCPGCMFSSAFAAIKRFAVRYIPHFRKRAERAAVTDLFDKLGDATAIKQQKEVDKPAARKTAE